MGRSAIGSVLLAGFIASLAVPSSGQWFNYPTPGIPRTPDGRPDLTAPAPRTPDGRPDLSGVWQPPTTEAQLALRQLLRSTAGPTFQPWAEEVARERRANNNKDWPRGRCLPVGMPGMVMGERLPLKIIQNLRLVVILHEAENTFRQIFLDGRQLARDPQPSWRGYSIGQWQGDDLVVETVGLNDKVWYADGHPTTETLHLTERYHRRDFGHLTLQITYEDPKALVKPWTSPPVTYALLADSDLLEEVCLENEKDAPHLVGR